MSIGRHAEVALRLRTAELTAAAIAPVIDSWSGLPLRDAYEIQAINVAHRSENGAKILGYKIGLTSRAMQRQLGVDVPDYGHLLSDMFVLEEEETQASGLIAPRAEPEIAFVLGRDIVGPGVSVAAVMAATDYVVPAIEVIDSRIADWRITVADSIADNASSARVVLGGMPTSLKGLDLPHVPVVFRKNGAIHETAAGAAVLGNPVSAVAWLLNALSEFDVGVQAGDIVLSGALCAAVSVAAGDAMTASFGGLGAVTARFGP